ncbi:MAG: hypothetical protein WCP73_00740 [Eubacteriales bacterium]
MSDVPVAVIENTISILEPAMTGIERPEVIPLLVFPAPTAPVSAGVIVTIAPGKAEKILLHIDDSYNCAVIEIVVPVNVNEPEVLKNAASEVKVPSRGKENARFANIELSISGQRAATPCAEVPNAIKLGIPARPPDVVVIAIGIPDANGMIELPQPVADSVAPADPQVSTDRFFTA